MFYVNSFECVKIFEFECQITSIASLGADLLLCLDKSGKLWVFDLSEDKFLIELDLGDMVVLYTDGLAEARRGDELFGEDRIATMLRRDPTVAPDVLCKSLLEAARNFAEGPVEDDVAILAIKRV